MRFSGIRLGAAAFAALLAVAAVAPSTLAQPVTEGLTVMGNGSVTAAPDLAHLNVGSS